MNYIDITQPNQTLSLNLNTSESTETIVTESEELVTNGNFDTDSDWILSNSTISNGQLNILTASISNTATQSISNLVVGSDYKIEYKINSILSGGLVAYEATHIRPSYQTDIGIYSNTFTATATTQTIYIRTSGATTATIGNVSVKEITEESNGVSINLSVYADGSDSLILNFDSSITSHNYYQTIEINSTELTQLKDETQYNIVGVDSNNKVIYRGKFQTTSKDILDYSINENKYTQKINSNNYTILD